MGAKDDHVIARSYRDDDDIFFRTLLNELKHEKKNPIANVCFESTFLKFFFHIHTIDEILQYNLSSKKKKSNAKNHIHRIL